MSIRFAILQEIEGKENIVLEYNETQILGRLQSRVREKLSEKEKYFMPKSRFTKGEVRESIDGSFADLVKEFKEETIKL